MKSVLRRNFIGLLFVVLGLALFQLGRLTRTPDVQAQAANLSETDLTPLRTNIKTFFENLSDNNKGAKKALEEIMKNSPVAGDEKLVGDLAAMLKVMGTRFGNYLTFEETGIKSIGNDLIVIRYLYKCQNSPVVWYFTYYRPPIKTGDVVAGTGTWSLIGLRFDSNIDVALKESGF